MLDFPVFIPYNKCSKHLKALFQQRRMKTCQKLRKRRR
nr:MAG TPA: hypothetical protein [Caudoviricetes sp.]